MNNLYGNLPQTLALSLSLLVISCNPQAATEAQPTTGAGQTASSSTANTPANSSSTASSLAPGRYCYGIDSQTLDGVVRLTVAENQTITGDSAATIQSEAEGYSSSYTQKLKGKLQNGQISMDVTTWIEYDVQNTQEVWTATPEVLKTEREEFTTIPCEEAREQFVGPDGLEAADLLEGATLRIQRVQFSPGKSSVLLENSVVRGERDVYLINAQGGQEMSLDLSSPEGNAVFDVISPSGYVLLREAEQETLALPQTGDYQVVVGGTRGNASYKLRVEIP
ncbi:MAG TPA: hypothetical protein V6D29_02170 [Leptolyngbyaceae cyanobacterium]